jgi:hypothetical protein
VRTSGGLGSVGTCKLSERPSFVRGCASSPGDAHAGASIPDSLSKSQCLGALRRFWCFLGPRAILTVM